MNKVLERQIEQSLKTMEQSKDWNKTYEEQQKILTENKQLLDQFYKSIKNYEHLQFYLVEVSPAEDNIFTVQARYKGQPIATISITKDGATTITTNDEGNKKTYGCDIQLKEKNLNDKDTIKFVEFFSKDIKPKVKIDEKAHIESMLLAEFGKTSSATKLLTGIQPIKYSNLYFQIPVTLNPKEETNFINVLTRTKVRKLTIIEPLTENTTPEKVLESATTKAIFLCSLLHTKQGQDWYRILRVPSEE